jgi:hypothetical protein
VPRSVELAQISDIVRVSGTEARDLPRKTITRHGIHAN